MGRTKQHVATEPTPGLKSAAWQSGLDAGRSPAAGRYGRPQNPYTGHYPGVCESVRLLLESIWNQAYEHGCNQRTA